MRNRDKKILESLERFGYLDRDLLIRMHFKGLKQPVTGCNVVMKRLRRDGYVEKRDWLGARGGRTFVYRLKSGGVRGAGFGGSVEHCLAVARFYCDIVEAGGRLEWFEMEKPLPKVMIGSKDVGGVADVYMKWYGTVFWVEIQRTAISEKDMITKLKKYEKLPGVVTGEERIWLVTDRRYNLENVKGRIIQNRGVKELLEGVK